MYGELHNVNAIQQVSLSPYTKTVVTIVTCSKRDKLSYIGRKDGFPSRKETYSTLSTLFYQFYGNLELSERIKGLSKFATKHWGSLLEYLLSLLYQLPYYIIIFLTVCIYPLTWTPTKVSFRVFSTVIFTHVNNYIRCYKIVLRRNTTLIIAVICIKYAVVKLKPEKRPRLRSNVSKKGRIRLWPAGLNWHFGAETDLLNFQCSFWVAGSVLCQLSYEASWELVTFDD